MKRMLLLAALLTVISLLMILPTAASSELEPNDQPENIQRIEPNTVIEGSISHSDDVDRYVFTIPSSGFISYELEWDGAESDDSQILWRGSMYTNPDDRDFISGLAGWANRSINQSITDGRAAGTYYIRITKGEDGFCDAPYRLKVNYTPTDFCELEVNDDEGQATRIHANQFYEGGLRVNGDTDWYVLPVDGPGLYKLIFWHEANSTESTCWKVVIQYRRRSETVMVAGNVGYVESELLGVESSVYVCVSRGDSYTGDPYSFALVGSHECTGTEFTTVRKATCVQSGLEELRCDVCRKTLEARSIPHTGHTADNGPVAQEPTCETPGQWHGTCTVCGMAFSKTLATIPHDFGDWVISTPAGCGRTGGRFRSCSVCNSPEQEEIPALEHIFGEWVDIRRSTCTSGGESERFCTLCGITEHQSTPVAEHVFGDGTVISGNKLIPPIVREEVCILCGYSRREKDDSFMWVLILAIVALIGIGAGVVNYIRAFRKK